MTVAELITRLQELPQEAEARVYEDYDGRSYLHEFDGVGRATYRGKSIVWLGNTTQKEIDYEFGAE